jgi:acyl-CoA reductase-like NAD-dependent aldehyde dehydrogenase
MKGTGVVETTVIESIDPRSGEVIGTAPVMDTDGVQAIVAKAREAAISWAELSIRDRSAHLRKVRQSLVDHAGQLAETCAAETGKSLSDAYLEVAGTCTLLTAGLKAAPRVLRAHRLNPWPMLMTKSVRIEYSPYGVIGEIAPWNMPIAVPGQILAVALSAGNVVVLKPSELTPLTGIALSEAINAAGRELLFVVTGYGPTGEALVRAGVDKIAFTGSPNTGRRILSAAADSLTPAVMELGGKDPMIVADDANPRRAALAAVGAAFLNSGQACIAAERILVTPGIYDRFVDEAVKLAGTVSQGPSPDDHIGSMTRGEQLPIIERRLKDAEAQGARILLGGHQRPGPGLYFEPTVIADVTPEMEIMQEETFGPVLAIMRVYSVDHAVAIANESEFGLNASVFTKNRRTAKRAATDLVSGGVNVNDAISGIAIPSAPFGGEKSSGFGRLQGREGLLEFSRAKTVVSELWGDRLPPMAGVMMTGRIPKPETIQKGLNALYGTSLRRRFPKRQRAESTQG